LRERRVSRFPACSGARGREVAGRLRRLYVDPGPYSRNGEWVRLTAEKLGADRILFGTDYGVGGGSRGDVGPAIATLDKSLTELERHSRATTVS
jgi:predicted TIM-barrel fold metal-dependent hydrolase